MWNKKLQWCDKSEWNVGGGGPRVIFYFLQNEKSNMFSSYSASSDEWLNFWPFVRTYRMTGQCWVYRRKSPAGLRAKSTEFTQKLRCNRIEAGFRHDIANKLYHMQKSCPEGERQDFIGLVWWWFANPKGRSMINIRVPAIGWSGGWGRFDGIGNEELTNLDLRICNWIMIYQKSFQFCHFLDINDKIVAKSRQHPSMTVIRDSLDMCPWKDSSSISFFGDDIRRW